MKLKTLIKPMLNCQTVIISELYNSQVEIFNGSIERFRIHPKKYEELLNRQVHILYANVHGDIIIIIK